MAGITKGMIIYAGPDDPASFEDAKALIQSRGYTKAQVRMYRKNEMLLIEALVNITAK